MIAFFDPTVVRDVFLLAVRFIVALAAFVVAYFLTGPLVQTVLWLIRRRTLPNWALAWVRMAAGIVVALIVFYWVHIGGWGGLGWGGGMGDGLGTGKGSPGTGTETATGKGPGTSKDTGSGPPLTERKTLVVQMLGPTTAEGDKCYRLDPKEPPLNWTALKSHIEANQKSIIKIEIVVTSQSVSRSDPLVEQLRQRAEELHIATLIKTTD